MRERKPPIVDRLCHAIAWREGYFLSARDAEWRKLKWPSVAQLCRNPGNIACNIDHSGKIQSWRGEVGEYPYQRHHRHGRMRAYVDFAGDVLMASGDTVSLPGVREGWRCLRVVVQRLANKGLTMREILTRHAEANGSDVELKWYLRDIFVKVGTLADRRLTELQAEEDEEEQRKGRRRRK